VSKKLVTLGRIAGVHGVRGWLKVHSYTEPRENIVAYGEWTVTGRGAPCRMTVEAGRRQGGNVLAKLRGIDTRDEAHAWIGAEVAVEREALPPCEPGEYYWTDLEGLEVRTVHGVALGRVDHLLATGAHDVLVLAGAPQRLIPFVPDEIVREVDLEAGIIVVDWEPEL
jgi:16S rRNA processing protein RimM